MMDPRAQDKDKPGREEKPAEKNARGARTEVVAPFAVNGDTEVRGTVRIAPAVLIELIELTVSDIPGVVELRQRRRRKPTESGEQIGKSYDDGKVRVSVAGDQIEADISIAVSVGTNISELASRVQKQVGIAAGRMLGMTVKTVNIYIDDIVDPTS